MDAGEAMFHRIIAAGLQRGLDIPRAFAHFDVLNIGAVTPDQFAEGLKVRTRYFRRSTLIPGAGAAAVWRGFCRHPMQRLSGPCVVGLTPLPSSTELAVT